MELEPMESVVISINEEVDEAVKKFEREFEFNKIDTMIHRFPAGLGAGIRNQDYIVPRLVAIGPYHHGEKHLQKMEEVKKAAAKYFCDQMQLVAPQDAYKRFRSIVKQNARGAYIEDTNIKHMKDDDFAAMMFRDACFLLLYMGAYHSSHGKTEDFTVNTSLRRFIFSNRDSIDNDIMLLENQLPWLVLQALMGLVVSDEAKQKLIMVVENFVRGMGNTFKIHESSEPFDLDVEKHPLPHLLALLRLHKIGGTFTGNDEKSLSQDILPLTHKNKKATRISEITPMQLQEIGIRLRASQSPAFTNLKFTEGLIFGELSLAPLSLDATRACCLVNMVAFEVCTASRFGDDPNKTAVCSYLALLAMLMVREEDVHKLRSQGILQGPHSNSEMLTFFKTIMKHIPHNGSSSAHDIMEKVENHKHNIPTKLYKLFHNNYVNVIKMVSLVATLIGIFQAVISLNKKD